MERIRTILEMEPVRPPELSVVIPAYREALRLPASLVLLERYLVARGLTFELLVVDDGSPDSTSEAVSALELPELRLLRHPDNRGKGAALRTGVLASRGSRVLLTDADLSTPIEELERLEPLLGEAELVFGSRARPDSQVEVRQPWFRERMGKSFNGLLRLLGLAGMPDTQCGFKLLRGEVARELFADLTIERFAYDVELLWLARKRGYRVVDVGVRWRNSPDSRVHPVRDSARMLRDVLALRWRTWLRRGRPRPS